LDLGLQRISPRAPHCVLHCVSRPLRDAMSNKATAHRVSTGADGVFLARYISVVVHSSWLTLNGGWGTEASA
jgi:hypothetical protein